LLFLARVIPSVTRDLLLSDATRPTPVILSAAKNLSDLSASALAQAEIRAEGLRRPSARFPREPVEPGLQPGSSFSLATALHNRWAEGLPFARHPRSATQGVFGIMAQPSALRVGFQPSLSILYLTFLRK